MNSGEKSLHGDQVLKGSPAAEGSFSRKTVKRLVGTSLLGGALVGIVVFEANAKSLVGGIEGGAATLQFAELLLKSPEVAWVAKYVPIFFGVKWLAGFCLVCWKEAKAVKSKESEEDTKRQVAKTQAGPALIQAQAALVTANSIVEVKKLELEHQRFLLTKEAEAKSISDQVTKVTQSLVQKIETLEKRLAEAHLEPARIEAEAKLAAAKSAADIKKMELAHEKWLRHLEIVKKRRSAEIGAMENDLAAKFKLIGGHLDQVSDSLVHLLLTSSSSRGKKTNCKDRFQRRSLVSNHSAQVAQGRNSAKWQNVEERVRLLNLENRGSHVLIKNGEFIDWTSPYEVLKEIADADGECVVKEIEEDVVYKSTVGRSIPSNLRIFFPN